MRIKLVSHFSALTPKSIKVTGLTCIAIIALLQGFNVMAQSNDYAVPLKTADAWELLTYSSIPSNQVSFTGQGVQVEVRQSASPLIFPLSKPLNIREISLSADISGDIQLAGRKQGEENTDDFVFRLGLVHEGDQTINFIQRTIAADWVRRLYDLAPEGTGVKNIRFYNVYSDDQLAGQVRGHPLTDLMVEHYIAARPDDGKLRLNFKPQQDSRVLALWISIDGDNTQSSYDVLIRELILKTN